MGQEPSFCARCLLEEARSSSPGAEEVTDDPLIGARIHSYEIRSLIGQGGMGRVYAAWHHRLERPVALKVLVGASPANRRRLLREGRSLSALDHPEIVTVHDLIVDDAGVFLVMELLDGSSLEPLLAQGPLPLEEALAFARSIARALQAAHEKGVIHRDLKPSNVMVTSRGAIKLVDFGLAKLSPARESASRPATRAGDILGTFGYMSPEQALGEPLDARSDLFSFGVLLYEMLSGRQAFAGSNPAVVAHRLITAEPLPLAELRLDLPRPLVTLVESCLRKSPEERPRDLAAVLRVLNGLDSAEPDRSANRGASPRNRVVSAGGTRRVWTAVAGLVLLVTLATLLWSIGGRQEHSRPPASPAVAVESPDAHFRAGLQRLERFDRKGNLAAARADFERALALDPEYPAAFAGLAEAQLETFINDNRDEAWLRRALDNSTRATSLDPHLAAAQVVLGRVQTVQGDYPAAALALERAQSLDSHSAALDRALGALAQSQQEWAGAEEHFSRAIETAPDDWRSYSGLVETRFAAGRFAEARSTLERWLAVTPDNVYALQSLGAVQIRQGDLTAAAASFQRALEIRPEANVYSNLGTLQFLQGLYQEAAEAFRRAVELKPNQRLFWFNLGDALRHSGAAPNETNEAFARAAQLTREALDKRPGDALLASSLAESQAKGGDPEAALATLERLESQPEIERPAAWYSAAKAYEIAGDRARALRALERALEAGYPRAEVEGDPDLLDLRRDLRFHRLAARFE